MMAIWAFEKAKQNEDRIASFRNPVTHVTTEPEAPDFRCLQTQLYSFQGSGTLKR